MAGWGIEPIKDAQGVVTAGTTSQEVRRVWGALYSPGVINGCQVTKSATAMTYKVNPGVAAVRITTGEVAMVAVPTVTVTAPTNTTAKTRVHTLYVRQLVPGSTNAIVVDVVDTEMGQAVTLPSQSQQIAQYAISAGATTSQLSAEMYSVPYSVPYGANIGTLYNHTDTSNAVLEREVTTRASGAFMLMTDRKLQITLDACLSARKADKVTRAYRFDDSAYCEVVYEIWIDGSRRWSWRTPGLHQATVAYHFSEFVNLAAGEHTIMYKTWYDSATGPGWALRSYAGTDANTGTHLAVRDAGFAEGIGFPVGTI